MGSLPRRLSEFSKTRGARQTIGALSEYGRQRCAPDFPIGQLVQTSLKMKKTVSPGHGRGMDLPALRKRTERSRKPSGDTEEIRD